MVVVKYQPLVKFALDFVRLIREFTGYEFRDNQMSRMGIGSELLQQFLTSVSEISATLQVIQLNESAYFYDLLPR